jgi:hypothetical protein
MSRQRCGICIKRLMLASEFNQPIKRLRDSIKDDFLTDPMYFTKVKYIDYENERFEGPIPELGALEPLFHKRKSYEHEKELRIITSNFVV